MFSHLPKLAQQLMQAGNVTLFYDQLFAKSAGSNISTPYHHDATFWPLANSKSNCKVVTMWIPLDPVSTKNGGLKFIVGSHRWNQNYKAISPDYNVDLINETHADIPLDIETTHKDKLKSFSAAPGDVLMFHQRTIHGGGHDIATDRRALAIRYCTDCVYQPTNTTMPMPYDPMLESGSILSGYLFPTVYPEFKAEEMKQRNEGPILPNIFILLKTAWKSWMNKLSTLV
jgi:ectoine hydroxylase-related dioxygenase (phytanoyl-CoA dioxygenase family)